MHHSQQKFQEYLLEQVPMDQLSVFMEKWLHQSETEPSLATLLGVASFFRKRLKCFQDEDLKKLPKNNVGRFLAAQVHLENRQFERALTLLDQIGKEDTPLCRYSALCRAKCYEHTRDFQKSFKELQFSLEGHHDTKMWQEAIRLYRKLKKNASLAGSRKVKLAVLGSSTSVFLSQMLDLAFAISGIEVDIYECPYGSYRQEAFDSQSELYKFKPDFVFIFLNHRDTNFPFLSVDHQEHFLRVSSEIEMVWTSISNNITCQIIQSNFDLPHYNSLGNYGYSARGSKYQNILELNKWMAERALKNVTVLDQPSLQAVVGSSWSDEPYWFFSKQHPSMEALPVVASTVASIALAHLGMSKKVLVLDLDNTLWWGVIGEDGLNGIKLGPPSQVGEACLEFQRYCLELKKRGIILAVCSKNNREDAELPFLQHDACALKLSDFAIFVANWNDKAVNIADIARQLNVGIDSLVFVDDNPAERRLVRELLPNVAVPDMPTDPALYIRTLEKFRYFEAISLSKEDFERNEAYQQNAQREAMKSQASSLDHFLSGLRMNSIHGPFESDSVARIAQLFGKTNQFNLTTKRYTDAQVRKMLSAEHFWTQQFRLADCFGDHGLVGVMLVEKKDSAEWVIDSWLMSCRVIGRSMEDFMLATLIQEAKKYKVAALKGIYKPTTKNQMVEKLYPQHGFDLQEELEDGTKIFSYLLDKSSSDKKLFIRSNGQ